MEIRELDGEIKRLKQRDETHTDALFSVHEKWSQVCADFQSVLKQLVVEAPNSHLVSSVDLPTQAALAEV